ncbi:hypothetical protein D0T49_03425 [Paludibacter sp. 221]|uniref:hypothetical protein n=1 Tax=Paludibacter sp. 221 TaxID=2302939 RepID=UPI0013D467FE|nr:hypothetical protein [Paludibacter sp. 221]NDV46091.1 hypothetical protein [Paludibacter sp. 221]
MIIIITNDETKTYSLQKDNQGVWYGAYGDMYARRTNSIIYFYKQGNNARMEYETFENGVEVDGEMLTPENAEEKLRKLFNSGGSSPLPTPINQSSDLNSTLNGASIITGNENIVLTLTGDTPTPFHCDITKYGTGTVEISCAAGFTLNREHTSLIIPDIDQAVAIVRVSDTDFSVIGLYEYQEG